MMNGYFGDNSELFFDINLIAANQETIPVESLLDTGFTTGWLAINIQDCDRSNKI